MSWPNFQVVEWGILIALSFLLPLSIFFSAAAAFEAPPRRVAGPGGEGLRRRTGSEAGLPHPSLELVRARYEEAQLGGAERKPTFWGRVRACASREVVAYLLPTGIFVLLSLMGFFLVLSAVHSEFKDANLLMLGLTVDPSSASASYQTATALIVSAGFLGAYVWSVNYLILRVANFDLSPLDFLRVSAHVLLTTLIAGVFRYFVGASTGVDLATASVLLAAFVIGLVPTLGLNTLIDRLPASFRLKRVAPEAKQIGRELPLDLIDGIDSAIKFRLANYEINDVQNLATENPINLYVGTPYNLLEILDWIAQAQLLVSLGPSKFLELRTANIRDSSACWRSVPRRGGRQLLKRCLFDQDAADDIVEANLKGIADFLHVQRLVHLRDVVASSLKPPTAAWEVAPGGGAEVRNLSSVRG